MVRWFPDADANPDQAWKVDPVHSQVEDLCDNFDTYLSEFKRSRMNSEKYMSLHKKTIDLRNELGGVAESIDSDECMRYLYDTLEAWGMNSQGAKMKERPEFAKSIRKYEGDIVALEQVDVAQIDEDVSARQELWRIIQGMKLSLSKYSQVVTGSKSLHHLLPQLLPPIDGSYTRPFFHYRSGDTKDNEYAFNLMLWYFAQIAQEVDLRRYVDTETARWATSETKMIDNAIIGFCNRHPGLKKKYNYYWRSRRYKNGVAVKPEAHIAEAHINKCVWCQAMGERRRGETLLFGEKAAFILRGGDIIDFTYQGGALARGRRARMHGLDETIAALRRAFL